MLSHLYPDGRSRIYNVYALVWAVGAASGPLVVTAALALGNWRFAISALPLHSYLPSISSTVSTFLYRWVQRRH